MRGLFYLASVGIVAGMLAACATSDPDAIAAMEVKGGGFEKALHAQYVRLARTERDRLDWRDSDHFAGKAEAVASTGAVEPDVIIASRLPDDKIADLVAARGRLTDALSGGGSKKAPFAAARAQTSFDCWMKAQEDLLASDQIAECRDQFEAAMAALDKAMAVQPVAEEAPKPAPAPAPAEQVAAAVDVDGLYIIFFDLNETELNAAGRQVIEKVAADFALAKPERVVVAGHADMSGTRAYNRDISLRRAQNVAHALIVAGVPSEPLMLEEFGESKPLRATSDGAAEGKNRRVEIVFF